MITPVRERIERFAFPEPNSGCWIWMGRVLPNGYGMLQVKGNAAKWEMKLAHRISYELFRCEIPAGLELDHLCRMRCCVNPDHLEPVSRKTNVERGIGPARLRDRQLARTHCKNGHPFSGENLRFDYLNKRTCKICEKASNRKKYLTKRTKRKP